MAAVPSQAPEPEPNIPAPGPSDVGYVLDALKLSVDQQLQLAQRLRDRARQVFVLAIAFFTVVQTVAFNAFAQGKITNHKAALISVLALAIAAIVFLALAAVAVLRADAPGTASDFSVKELQRLLNAAYRDDPKAAGELGGVYLDILGSRQDANKVRQAHVRQAQICGLVSIGITTAELILSLALRIP